MIEDFEAKFLAFCKAKPADEGYAGCSILRCALAQFVRSICPNAFTGNTKYWPDGRDEHNYAATPSFTYPESCRKAALTSGPGETFGELALRLEALNA